MGEVRVPVDAKWQAQTQRAVENFPISGMPIERALICGAGLHQGRGGDGERPAEGDAEGRRPSAIHAAAAEVADGRLGRPLPGRRVPDRLGHVVEHEHERGARHAGVGACSGAPVHPNDHVNASQSSNDVFPSAIHLAAVQRDHRRADPRPRAPRRGAAPQAAGVPDGGEGGPHPPDGRHAGHPRPGVRRLRHRRRARRRAPARRRCPASASCRSAAPPSAPASTRRRASPGASSPGWPPSSTCRSPRPATTSRPRARATPSSRPAAMCRVVAVSLNKIAFDLRLMSSGPRTGLAEIHLPDLQPGLVDHAGQGEPGRARGGAPGGGPGDRQRRRRGVGRRHGQPRAERDAAGDRPQPARVDPAAGVGEPHAGRQVRRRHRGRRRAVPHLRRCRRRRSARRSTRTSATRRRPR